MENSHHIKNAIEIHNLTKCYGKNRGVKDITLCVEEGDIFGYLGPNGAGKSTSIRCMLGMLRFTEGEIRVLGNLAPKEQTQILRRTGYMPSEAMFYPSMKVADVIRFAADMRGINCTKEAKRLCERLEMDTSKKIEELSLGNRKKVSIVCAMQHNPELLILDEPTSGLDPFMQEAFFELLTEYNRKGTTCFLSSHVLPEVKKYCRNVGIIKDGRIVGVDSVENMMHSNLRKVKLKGVGNAVNLEKMPGVTGMLRCGSDISFSYSGENAALLAALYQLQPQDALIEEPSLEEVFMHFYEEKKEA